MPRKKAKLLDAAGKKKYIKIMKDLFTESLKGEGKLDFGKVQRDYWRSNVPGYRLVEITWGSFDSFKTEAIGIWYEHPDFINRVISLYIKYYLENSDAFKSEIMPSRYFAKYAGFKDGVVARTFPRYTTLHDAAVKKSSQLRKVIAEKIANKPVTREDIHVVKSDHSNKKSKRYFISSILPESFLDKEFFASVLYYCKITGAELVILPMRGIHHTHKHYSEEVMAVADKFVTEYHINDNVKVLEAQIPPMCPDPIALALRLAKDSSLILASPKQDLRSLPVLNTDKPKSIWTTGVLTSRLYPKTASGFKGELDSVLGGLILEVDPKTDRFYCRQVQANSDGSFYDMNKRYSATKVVPAKAAYLYVGDVHSGFTLDYARKASIEMANDLGVKCVGGGDWMDCYSISHHHEKKIKTKVLKQERHDRKHVSTLQNELDTLAKELLLWVSKLKPGVTIDVIKSNHDEHLDRYIEEQRWFNDFLNYRVSLDLAGAYLDGKNPIQHWVESNYPDLKGKINWLARDSAKRVSDKYILVSQHGDLGPNGSRSTNKNAEWSYLNCILGHSHSPSVMRVVKRVGTLALGLEYVIGASSHQVMNCAVYENGNYQMLWVANDGKWHL